MEADAGALLDWIKVADMDSLHRFHKLQLVFSKVEKRISKENSTKDKLLVYGAQHVSLPFIFDRVVSFSHGDLLLSHFVEDYAHFPVPTISVPTMGEGAQRRSKWSKRSPTEAVERKPFDSGHYLYKHKAPALLMWLNEAASDRKSVV